MTKEEQMAARLAEVKAYNTNQIERDKVELVLLTIKRKEGKSDTVLRVTRAKAIEYMATAQAELEKAQKGKPTIPNQVMEEDDESKIVRIDHNDLIAMSYENI